MPQGGNNPPERPPTSTTLPPSRFIISVACESCRRGRPKCSEERPSRQAYSQNNRVSVYRDEAGQSRFASPRQHNEEANEKLQRLQQSHISLQSIIVALQTRDDSMVATIVLHLRDAQDPDAVAKQLEGGDLLLQLHVRPAAAV
ncbi:hypothetical protein PWT90_03220 [Aphanocladium album]|nr:hypothetical protein PWT90_03220 [Aphanocladium album]